MDNKEDVMRRKGFVIFMGIVLALVVCAAPIGGVVNANGGYDAVVEATGDDKADCERPDLKHVYVTQDVCNVQAAVNANPGGRILLKGTFHFAEYGDDGYVVPGTDGTIFITNDIEIHGEKQGNTFLTKIKGGYNTFSIGYKPIKWAYKFISDELKSKKKDAVPVKATIQDIEFDNSFYVAIKIWATTGLTIKGNRIIDGRSSDLTDLCGFCHAQGTPIFAFPPGGWDKDNSQLISGKITIEYNYIDGRYRWAEADDPWAVPSDGNLIRGLTGAGIWLAQSDADITIRANELYNMWDGILSYGNAGQTTIVENLIDLPAQDPDLYQYPLYGIEICGFCFQDAYETTSYVIRDNDITLGGHFATGNQWTFGILVDGVMNTSVVTKNRINLLSDGFVGIELWNVSNAKVVENKIEGEGQFGVVLGDPDYPSFYNTVNTAKENKLNNFDASVVDYYLGEGVTNNTLYLKMKDTVLNESGNDTNTIYR
jgi:hypothetical protein